MSPNCIIAAIGSRSLEKATNFAKANGFPESAKVYGSYEAVLDDPDVDAVYIPLPSGLHLHWAVLAAEKKKHILLEKPVAANVKELDVILEACESNKVQYMDSTMWMHHPRTAQMKEFLSDPHRFGRLKMIQGVFCYPVDPEFLKNDIRVKPELEALGALGDQGWYPIRAMLWATDYELPKTVTALREPELSEAGVILSCGASLCWEDRRTATFYCSFLSNLITDLTVIGTGGILRVPDYIVPFNEKSGPYYTSVNGNFLDRALGCEPIPSEHIVTNEVPQEVTMVNELSSLINGIKGKGSEPEKKWADISRKTQLLVDAVMESIQKGFVPVEVIP